MKSQYGRLKTVASSKHCQRKLRLHLDKIKVPYKTLYTATLQEENVYGNENFSFQFEAGLQINIELKSRRKESNKIKLSLMKVL